MTNNEAVVGPTLEQVLEAQIVWRKERNRYDGDSKWQKCAVSLPLETKDGRSYRPMTGKYSEVVVRDIDHNGDIGYGGDFIFEFAEWRLEKPVSCA